MIVKPLDRLEQFTALRQSRQSKGFSTGFQDLDEFMKLEKGYLMVVTGIPGMGKSEWLDAVLMNLSLLYGFRVLYYSPENAPVEEHMKKLAEKYIGKRISDFTTAEMSSAMEYLTEHFTWMDPENPTLDVILECAQKQMEEEGLDVLVIDPWAAVAHQHTNMLHEYLAHSLTRIIRFARKNKVLVVVVAHPVKPQPGRDGIVPVPDLYSISDGAMWRNRMDWGVICHRPDMSKNVMDIYIGKARFKWMGRVGMVTLQYNYTNGRFKGPSDKDFQRVDEVEPAF